MSRASVDPGGFPEVHLFGGNKAETTTLVLVLQAFQERRRHPWSVADAGMLSAANLERAEDAGSHFHRRLRPTKAPMTWADHFQRKGNYFTDGRVLESTRVMGTGKAARLAAGSSTSGRSSATNAMTAPST